MYAQSILAFPKNSDIHCRFWENECVVYHELSGETHLLTDLGAYLLKAIFEQPCTYPELLTKLTSAFELPLDFDLASYVDQLIGDYQRLGLLVVSTDKTVL